MAFPCTHRTHGMYNNLYDITYSSPLHSRNFASMPYHTRANSDVQWQQTKVCLYEKEDHGYGSVRIQDLTGSKAVTFDPILCYQITAPVSEGVFLETMLIDEIDKKLYLIHSPNGNRSRYIIHKVSIELNKQEDGRRWIQKSHSPKLYLGRIDFKTDERIRLRRDGFITDKEADIVKWFFNPFDGSIFQIHTYFILKPPEATTCHTISWLKLDDTVRIEGLSDTYCGVKVETQYKLECDQYNMLDFSCIQFSENGRKMLLRFRLAHPGSLTGGLDRLDDTEEVEEMRESLTNIDPDDPFVSQMTKRPVYALFGLDHETNTIELLTQFKPTSYENHCKLLISPRLLAVFSGYTGFPNSKAVSFLSQRTVMIGQFLKYTFFSAMHKKKLAVLAVKSIPKTLENDQLALTPKKLWFPLEDTKFKEAFQKLTHLIKWDMLTEHENNLFVVGREFILQVLNKESCDGKLGHLSTIRVKLGAQYKDYRECAGCGKIEEYKRRNRNGKRISQFKVCSWCKDHSLHKMWWDRTCHYCSEKCADDHWLKHKLQHEEPREGKKGKGKKNKK